MANQSEKQLNSFLKFKKAGGFKINFRLRGQGGNTTYSSTKKINLCEVIIEQKEYMFGGISEKFYDKMVDKFHN